MNMSDREEPQVGAPLLERHDMTMAVQPNTVVISNQQVTNHQHQLYVMGFVEEAARRIGAQDKNDEEEEEEGPKIVDKKARKLTRSVFLTAMSFLYAKLVVILGVAFPVTEVLAPQVPGSFYQGFYLYLYLGSIAFMCFLYAMTLKERAVKNIISRHRRTGVVCQCPTSSYKDVVRYGSFYLRLGAIGFGIGSMVYSGLEFGQHIANTACDDILLVMRPAARMLLTLGQIQFIFLNNKDMKMGRYLATARFGLMHMIATNLCEWLYVLVEETKHEIAHLSNHQSHHHTNSHENMVSVSMPDMLNETEVWELENKTDLIYNVTGVQRAARSISVPAECSRHNIVGTLVQNSSPFLFPCTIEYSLICAVTLYEMWKHIKEPQPTRQTHHTCHRHAIGREFSSTSLGGLHSAHRFSVDCHSVHKGLFAGILVLVLTIISLVLFFVLHQDPQYKNLAVFEVSLCEMALYSVSALVVLISMLRLRMLPLDPQRGRAPGLDNSLLIMAQAGMYVYCTFSVIGFYYAVDNQVPGGMVTEIIALIQTTGQTIFVLDACNRRCRTKTDKRRKPGRQLVTFLIIANMAMWMINTLEKGHAVFRPSHLKFFGVWAWAVITHVSMPLAIFYRFHSTICLFEIWKSAYKLKPELFNP